MWSQVPVHALEDQEASPQQDRSRLTNCELRTAGSVRNSLPSFPVKLRRDFYSRPAIDVASDLLGKVLVRRLGRRTLSGMIVETEAYVGPHDLACHASKGRTRRTEVMFGPAGHAYVYMIYGFHFCLNAVTDHEGFPSAVLIRAFEPLENVELMRQLRGSPSKDTDIGSGPGKLCRAMAIDKELNGEDLEGRILWIEDRHFKPATICTSPRVGVDYAGEYKEKPWRFYIGGSPHVSRVRFKLNLGVQ
jgi:DNA-3-methyladenine glycosylase